MEPTPQVCWANASQVTDQLWIGGDLEINDDELAALQLDELDRLGIDDIVDVRLEWNDEDWVTVAKPHIRYHWLGVDDAGQRMPHEWFDAGTEITREALAAGHKVLVHCHMGINRGPSLGFATLLTLGWTPADALSKIRQARPIAHVWYAEDAVDWWCIKNHVSRAHRDRLQAEVRWWRSSNPLNVAGVIRKIRLREGA